VLGLEDLERRSRSVARAWVRFFHKHPDALDHSDWRWVARLGIGECDRFVVDQLPQILVWGAAARELAALDVGWLELASGSAAALSVLKALGQPLEALNRVWWHEGFAEGLADFGVDSFAAFAARDGAGRRRLLVWPDYAGQVELDLLLREFGKQLAGREDVQLLLIHDGEVDGDSDEAVAQLERAYAAHVPDGALLDVVLWTDALTERAIDKLRGDVRCCIELPESATGRRRRLLDRLQVPRARTPEELAAQIGFGPTHIRVEANSQQG